MKYCSNCGAKLDDDARFCDNCGTPTAPESTPSEPQQPAPQESAPETVAPAPETTQQEAAAPEETAQETVQEESTPQKEAQQAPAPQQPAAPAKPKQPSKFGAFVKKHIIPIAIAAVLLIAVIGVSIFFATRPATLKLDSYISVKFDGYDSQGTAQFDFDTDAFMEDYGSKIKLKKSKADDLFSFIDSFSEPAELLVDFCIDGDLDKWDHLSNGDQVTFTWQCDEEAAMDLFHVRLSYEDITFTVEGLSEAQELDPFADFELEVSGFAPYATASYNYNSNADYAWYLDFELSASENLKNGDTITVSVKDADDSDWQEDFLEDYGVILTQTEKTFTVEGLEEYVTDLSQITDEAMAQMDAQVEDVITSLASNWKDCNTIASMEHTGCYLLNAKVPSFFGSNNKLFVVYTVNVSTDLETEEGPVHDEFPYYMIVGFSDLILHPDGSVGVDTSNYTRTFSQFKREVGDSAFYFYGYENMEKLVKDNVNPNLKNYTCTTDIAE